MRSRFHSFFALFGVLMLGATALVALAPAAGADTIGPVDASIPDGDAGSLRDVLENQANDGDVIQLQPNATYQLTDCEAHGGGNLSTDASFTVQGNLATIQQTCDSYVWEIGGDVNIDGLTITGGFDVANRPAGAIHMDGDELVITNSSIVNNQTCGDGGGIYMHTSEGLVHVENSTIAGNSAAGGGGAIASAGDSDTEIEIVNSTITGNSAGWGGAIDLQNGEQLSLTYVTLAGNSTDAEGISCESDGEAASDVNGAVTPTAHAQANGSAANVQFDSEESTLTTFGSVIALPVDGPNCNVELEVVPAAVLDGTDSQGYNYSDDSSCDLTGTGDRQGAADPQLLPLGPNGGPTETRPPAETSPLIDGVALAACHPDGIARDQRDIARPQRAACDVGAVELVALTPTPTPTPTPSPLVVTPRFTG